MKTKGRFIAILAVLSLLISILPIGPAGAATGVVALDKTYYSDKDTFNIVTISVTDSDLSAQRSGVVRFANVAASTTTFAIPSGIVEGELAKTDTFSSVGDSANQTLTLSTSTNGGTDKNKDGALTVADVTLKRGSTTLTPVSVTVVSGKITAVVLAAADNTSASTDDLTVLYQYTEYDFADTTKTPINLSGVTVFFGTGVGNETNQVLAQGVTQSTGTITISASPAIPSVDEVLINFPFDVKDSKADNVTISSNTSVAGGKTRSLKGVESTATSGKFESQVALFTAADVGKVESESTDGANDLVANGGDADGKVQVDELNNTTGLGTALNTRIQADSGTLGLTTSTTLASDLLKQLLPVSDGDTLTATYVDANPTASLTKTATVDLAAPTVTLVTPIDKVFTSEQLVTLTADVVDTGAGVDQADITLVPASGATFGTPILPPIQSGFRISTSPTTAITEGAKTWYVRVKDKVGNTPTVDDTATTTVNEATRGAAPPTLVAENPFAFTVDITGPTVSTATTGLYLKNPGVTTGTTVESQSTDSRTWVRLLLSLGTGTAPIDATTVATSDFRVAGVEPISVLVNTVAHESGAIVVGSAVYMEVAEQDTDARPKVEIVGEIKDKAGNARTSGTISAAADQLSPVLTVASTSDLAEKEMTVTVTSTEALVVNPTIEVTTTEPAAGVVTAPTALTVTSTGTKSWTAKYTNPTAGKSKQWVVVTGTDIPGNTSKLGEDTPDKDLFAFQVDDAPPTVAFKDAGSLTLATTDQQEGAVWIVSEFDEDEYTGDSYKTVTVTAVTLKVKDGADITTAITDLFTSDSISYTLAVNLTPGTYNISITGADSAGNSVTANTDFKVVAKVAFSLALKPGVNLASIPGTPVGDGGNLNVLLDGLPVTAVVTYNRALDLAGENPWLTSTKDAETGLFTGDIAVIEPGKAYFITATASATAKVLIEQPSMVLPPTIQVKQGFNALGFWSISGATTADIDDYLNSIKWTVAYTFDPTPGIGWIVIRPDNPATVAVDTQAASGTGYLIFVTEDGTLTP